MGPSWALLGAILRPREPFGNERASPQSRLLGPSWGALGRSWDRLGPFFGHYWSPLGLSWSHLEASGALRKRKSEKAKIIYHHTYRCDLAMHYFDRPTVPGMCAGVCCAGMCAGSWAVSVYSLDVLGCVLGCVLPAGCVLGCALGCVALRCERGAGLCRCTPSTCWDVCWGVLANMCAGCVLPPRAGAMRCDVSGVLGCVGVLPRCAGMCAGMCAASVRWDTCWAMCWDVGWVCWGVWAKMCVGMRAAPVCWDSCWDVCRAC